VARPRTPNPSWTTLPDGCGGPFGTAPGTGGGSSPFGPSGASPPPLSPPLSSSVAIGGSQEHTRKGPEMQASWPRGGHPVRWSALRLVRDRRRTSSGPSYPMVRLPPAPPRRSTTSNPCSRARRRERRSRAPRAGSPPQGRTNEPSRRLMPRRASPIRQRLRVGRRSWCNDDRRPGLPRRLQRRCPSGPGAASIARPRVLRLIPQRLLRYSRVRDRIIASSKELAWRR